MKYPSADDFLEEFGIEPVEVDPTLALCLYRVKSKSGDVEVDVSFSVVMGSFQVVLKVFGQELAVVSSESVKSVELVRDEQGAGVRVIFDIRDSLSEARVLFEPDVSFRWWILSDVRG